MQKEKELKRYERAKNDPLYQLERETGQNSGQLYNKLKQEGYTRNQDGTWSDKNGNPVSLTDLRTKVMTKSGSGSTTPEFDAWLNKGASDNKVYFGIKNGEAQYTGITKQTLDARLSQHNANGKGFQRLEEQFSGLTRNQARAIEQYYIENGPNNLNKINSISSNHRFYQDAMNWAKQYLGVD